MSAVSRRKNRVRFSLKKRNKSNRIRLVVSRSNQHIYAQLISDIDGVTLAQASTLDKELASKLKSKSNVEAASSVGALIAEKAKKVKVTEVVFDRGGCLYHGRIKALADAARNGGLKF